MMNDSRSRMKAVLVTSIRFFDEPRAVPARGIAQISDDATKTKIADDVVPMLKDLIVETEVGVIDFKSKAYRDAEPEEMDVTHEMMEVCRNGATVLAAAAFYSLLFLLALCDAKPEYMIITPFAKRSGNR